MSASSESRVLVGLGKTSSLAVAFSLATVVFGAFLAQADTVTEPSEPTEGGKQSTGRTIDCTVSGVGGPIDSAKVTVTLSVSGKEDCKATNIDTGKSLSEAVCMTDEQGRYQIKIPAALAGNPALRLAVSVEHPNCAPRSIGPLPVSDFDMHKIEDGDAYWLRRQMGRRAIKKTSLREGRQLAGRVLLPDGSPAVGASVVTRTKYEAYSWKFHSPDRRRISLLLATQSGYSDYRGRALPNEELVLRVVNRVDRKETVLHEERLTLAPGEERLRTIEISDR
jgi:hypothetical protein